MIRFNSLEELTAYICSILRDPERWLIACVGTELRSDDRAGLEVCRRLESAGVGVRTLLCEHGIENCFHSIVTANKSSIMIIDSAIVPNSEPGAIVAISEDEISDFTPLTTHTIPLTLILEILKRETSLSEIVILGINVKKLDIGFEMSLEVERAVKNLVSAFIACLRTGSR
ncbi:MAG TPA: hydrogenase maturation protease [Ignisphaera sp.]|uniref:Hydrogenase maturation protease n=1 Tax=Ignisphaera aggregans TaxID=334771 RepID=A0A833DTJ5_9CREN|nr:hydrogenase maturation protease [Ignisphaera sp.]HIP56975.1 hydrogenase maturation protease [Ignisphaera aggregans]